MRIIVCGGRRYADSARVWMVLEEYADRTPTIVTGGAPGADRLAFQAARDMSLPAEIHDAQWEAHGPSAGPMRNEKMARLGADLVIAFPGGRGTADMLRRAKAHGIPVRNVQDRMGPANA